MDPSALESMGLKNLMFTEYGLDSDVPVKCSSVSVRLIVSSFTSGWMMTLDVEH